MLKLLKHDLKNNLKICLIALFVGIFANSLLYVFFKNTINLDSQTFGTLEMFFFVLCILAVFGSLLALLVLIVMIFRRDYYSDRGYMMFTLPVKSNDIIMSKLLFALIWNLIFSVSFILVNFLGMYLLGSDAFLSALGKLINNPFFTVTPFTYISMAISYICKSFIGFITIYFAIVATKSLFPSSRTGYFWIIIMIGINMILSFIDAEIFERFPYIISYVGQGIVNVDSYLSLTGQSAMNVKSIVDFIGMPISSMILWIIAAIVMYQASIKIMDNSVDI